MCIRDRCQDVLKSKLAPKFIEKNGTPAYMENPEIIVKLADEMNKYIKRIETSFVNFKKLGLIDEDEPSVKADY